MRVNGLNYSHSILNLYLVKFLFKILSFILTSDTDTHTRATAHTRVDTHTHTHTGCLQVIKCAYYLDINLC